jgi:hypothetical protein
MDLRCRTLALGWWIVVAMTVGACASGDGSTSSIGKPVSPGQPFPNGFLLVRSPNSEGWTLQTSSRQGISFSRVGPADNESTIAQVSLFELPPTKDADAFVAFIRSGVERETPPERFETLEVNYEYLDQRGYPCVKMSELAEDKLARTSSLKRERLNLQVRALYCRHPKNFNFGFSAAFSHRGATIDKQLGAQAQSFIDGVQVAQ